MIRSQFGHKYGDDVTAAALQTTQILHKAKLDAIDEAGAAQQLRNMYQVSTHMCLGVGDTVP